MCHAFKSRPRKWRRWCRRCGFRGEGFVLTAQEAIAPDEEGHFQAIPQLQRGILLLGHARADGQADGSSSSRRSMTPRKNVCRRIARQR
jgi:hypothetical protein